MLDGSESPAEALADDTIRRGAQRLYFLGAPLAGRRILRPAKFEPHGMHGYHGTLYPTSNFPVGEFGQQLGFCGRPFLEFRRRVTQPEFKPSRLDAQPRPLEPPRYFPVWQSAKQAIFAGAPILAWAEGGNFQPQPPFLDARSRPAQQMADDGIKVCPQKFVLGRTPGITAILW